MDPHIFDKISALSDWYLRLSTEDAEDLREWILDRRAEERIREAANALADAWEAGRFTYTLDSRQSEEAKALRWAIADAGLLQKHFSIVDAVLAERGLSPLTYTDE